MRSSAGDDSAAVGANAPEGLPVPAAARAARSAREASLAASRTRGALRAAAAAAASRRAEPLLQVHRKAPVAPAMAPATAPTAEPRAFEWLSGLSLNNIREEEEAEALEEMQAVRRQKRKRVLAAAFSGGFAFTMVFLRG